MTCDEALRSLLEADLSEPGSGSPLGRHLEKCARCRRAAGLLTQGTSSLDAWLGREGPAPEVDAVLRRAADPDGRTSRDPGRPAVLRAAPWALPLAAAAAVTAILLLRDPAAPPHPAPGPSPSRPTVEGLALDVPPGRDAAVLHTADPNITVVWFYGGER